MTTFIVKEGYGTFSWPFHRSQVYNQLCKVKRYTRFRDPYARFSDSALYLLLLWPGRGKMSALKKLIRMSGPSSGLVFELRRIISNQKWANAWLVLRYIGLGWFIIMVIFWQNKLHTSKLVQARHRTTLIHFQAQFFRQQISE